MSARRKPKPEAPPPAASAIVCLGRSGSAPLRLKARLAGREAATVREGTEAAGIELTLWAREPAGWAAALQIDADGAAGSQAVKADTAEAALDWAVQAATAAFTTPDPIASGPLSTVETLACRRYRRALLARRVGTAVAAMAERLGAKADG